MLTLQSRMRAGGDEKTERLMCCICTMARISVLEDGFRSCASGKDASLGSKDLREKGVIAELFAG